MDLIAQRLSELCDSAKHSPPVYRTQIAAGIFLDTNCIAIGHNSYRTHPFRGMFAKSRQCIYIHAEVDAIRAALMYTDLLRIRRASIYVAKVRWSNDHQTKIQALARPCEGCQRCLATFGIEEVFYTLDNKGYGML